jgi:hypothetical protein
VKQPSEYVSNECSVVFRAYSRVASGVARDAVRPTWCLWVFVQFPYPFRKFDRLSYRPPHHRLPHAGLLHLHARVTSRSALSLVLCPALSAVSEGSVCLWPSVSQASFVSAKPPPGLPFTVLSSQPSAPRSTSTASRTHCVSAGPFLAVGALRNHRLTFASLPTRPRVLLHRTASLSHLPVATLRCAHLPPATSEPLPAHFSRPRPPLSSMRPP